MKIKKALSVVAALAISAALSLPAFAATGINAYEQKILDKLQTTVTTASGAKITIPQSYISQAKAYLSRSDVDISSDEASVVLKQINAAIKIVEESDADSLEDLSAEDKSAILEAAEAAASELGLTLSYNASTRTITIKDADGNIVFRSGDVIKTTGAQLPYAAMGVGAAIIVLAGGSFVILRKRAGNA